MTELRSPEDEIWVALATAPDASVAERLGRLAVEAGHAACANIVPGLRSLFRWKGAVQDEPEVLILFKTTAAAFSALAELVRKEHPYEIPELIALPVADGLAPYLGWVRRATLPLETPRPSV